MSLIIRLAIRLILIRSTLNLENEDILSAVYIVALAKDFKCIVDLKKRKDVSDLKWMVNV